MTVELCYDSEWLISSEAYEIYKDCMYKPAYEKYLKKIRDYFDNDDTFIFICSDNSEAVGILAAKKLDNAGGEIIGIAVKADCRRKGIGTLLVEKAAKMMNVNKFTAQTDEDTVLFYHALGFDRCEENVKFPDGVCTRYNCEKQFKYI